MGPPLASWLAGSGYRVLAEVPIVGRWADLVGTREAEVVAIELKLRDWRGALHQAVAYQIGADRAWVAMPLAAASRAYRHRYRFEREGVGLLAVDDQGGVRIPIPAESSPRLLPFVREGILASFARPSVLPGPPLGVADAGPLMFRSPEDSLSPGKDFRPPRM